MKNTTAKNKELAGVIIRLLSEAKRQYGDKYYKFSIQILDAEVCLIGHKAWGYYEPDEEQKLCSLSELLSKRK